MRCSRATGWRRWPPAYGQSSASDVIMRGAAGRRHSIKHRQERERSMAETNDGKPKIIVDSDWKEEARREKEELDRQTRDMPKAGELPAPHLAEIVQMIVVQASVGLGGFQDPQTGQRIPPQLSVAKHYIDLLELLQQKTSDNLDDEEKTILDRTLHELRMAFVQTAGSSGAPPKDAS
jgi:hypothetical protein